MTRSAPRSACLTLILPLILAVPTPSGAQTGSVAAYGSAKTGVWAVRQTAFEAHNACASAAERYYGRASLEDRKRWRSSTSWATASCKAVLECSRRGYGALARGKNADNTRATFGGACGESTAAAAVSRAINRCRFNNGQGCTIESDWNTGPPAHRKDGVRDAGIERRPGAMRGAGRQEERP